MPLFPCTNLQEQSSLSQLAEYCSLVAVNKRAQGHGRMPTETFEGGDRLASGGKPRPDA